MSFTYDPKRVVFEGSVFIVYDVSDLLPKHPRYPHGSDVIKPNGKLAVPAHHRYCKRNVPAKKLFIHQEDGGYAPGWRGLVNCAAFIVRDPAYKNGRWTGAGRGWPGFCYPYYAPHKLERTPEGKLILFKCQPDDEVCWHTAGHNGEATAIGFQGHFAAKARGSNWVPYKGTTGQPSHDQMLVLRKAWEEYFKPKYGMSDGDVYGHAEAKYPKPACPGDRLLAWCRDTRHPQSASKPAEPDGQPDPEGVALPVPEGLLVELDTWERRQAALVELGFDLGSSGPLNNGVDDAPGRRTRGAVEELQGMLALPQNGVWDDHLQLVLQLYMLAVGVSEDDLQRHIP